MSTTVTATKTVEKASKGGSSGPSTPVYNVSTFKIPEAKYGVLLTALALSIIYIDGTLACDLNCL